MRAYVARHDLINAALEKTAAGVWAPADSEQMQAPRVGGEAMGWLQIRCRCSESGGGRGGSPLRVLARARFRR
jgi:hypothetical protein